MQPPVLALNKGMSTLAIGNPKTSPAPSPLATGPGRLKLLGLALLSGAMLFLCHFPVAWGWLGWVALVPLLPLVLAETRPWWRYLCAWLAATAYFWPALSWMTVADSRMIGCWALLCFYLCLYFPLAIYLVRRLQHGTRLPLLLLFPMVWTALEFFRASFGTGFSWYLLGHSQHNVLHVIQIADLGGVFAVSFLVAAVNVVVFEGLTRLGPVRHWLRLPPSPGGQCCQRFGFQLGCIALLLGATVAYGAWCLSQDDFEAGPRIALLQGSLDQRLRLDPSPGAKSRVRASYVQLCQQASALKPTPQLIVWPETSYPYPWVMMASHNDLSKETLEFQKDFSVEREIVGAVGSFSKTNVLLGLNTEVKFNDTPRLGRFNSALLVNAQGEAINRYDKIHRLPFGEYVPFRDWLPFMNRFAPYDFDYSIGCGDGLTRFTLGKYSFGVLICYEDTDPFMARDYGITTSDGPPVDFLVNISNDGWFNGSSEHEEHLAVMRFRAIEARRALARSVNMGISAVVDGNGRVIAPVKSSGASPTSHEVWTIPDSGNAGRHDLAIEEWGQYKQAEGILVVDMPIDRRTSVYATCGDWLPYSCWALIGGGLVWGWRRRRIVAL